MDKKTSASESKSVREIRATIRQLKTEFRMIKDKIESPERGISIPLVYPREHQQLLTIRQYIEQAKQDLLEKGASYKPTVAEAKAVEFEKNIPFIKEFFFSIGGYFGGEPTTRKVVFDKKNTVRIEDISRCCACGQKIKKTNVSEKKFFLEQFRDLHIGEWEKHYLNHGVCDGTQWSFEITFSNGCQTLCYSGSNAYPYNFALLQQLLQADEGYVERGAEVEKLVDYLLQLPLGSRSTFNDVLSKVTDFKRATDDLFFAFDKPVEEWYLQRLDGYMRTRAEDFGLYVNEVRKDGRKSWYDAPFVISRSPLKQKKEDDPNDKKLDKKGDVDNEKSDEELPTFNSFEEISRAFAEISLVGRTIKRLRNVGHCYNLTQDHICSYLLGKLEEVLPEEEARKKINNFDRINPKYLYPRWVEGDEYLLIEFEDGDVFAIETPWEGEFCFGLNVIPWDTPNSINDENADADVIFSPLKGLTISAVEVNKRTVRETDVCYDEDEKDREIVESVVLRCENGLGLQIAPYYDFCHCSCVNECNKDVMMPLGELRHALFNWEDLHSDKITGTQSQTASLYFGEYAAQFIEEPYVRLIASKMKDSCVMIKEKNDFFLLGWCIAYVTQKEFDKYATYKFSPNDWWHILNKARSLIGECESLKQFIREIKAWRIEKKDFPENPYKTLAEDAASFWNWRDYYEAQLVDLRRWTYKVLKKGDTMVVKGISQ